MSDKRDRNAQRTRMMEIRHEYGQTFTTSVPEEQPFPDEWEPVLPGPDEKGRLIPIRFCKGDFPTSGYPLGTITD